MALKKLGEKSVCETELKSFIAIGKVRMKIKFWEILQKLFIFNLPNYDISSLKNRTFSFVICSYEYKETFKKIFLTLSDCGV